MRLVRRVGMHFAILIALVAPAYAAGTYDLAAQFQPSDTNTYTGTFGGLPARIQLAGDGTFTLRTALGKVEGTYTSANGTVTLTVERGTGIYAKAIPDGTTFRLGTVDRRTVLIPTTFRTHGGYVSVVAKAAQALRKDGKLPAGMTVGRLVSQAAHNQKQAKEANKSTLIADPQKGKSAKAQEPGTKGKGHGK